MDPEEAQLRADLQILEAEHVAVLARIRAKRRRLAEIAAPVPAPLVVKTSQAQIDHAARVRQARKTLREAVEALRSEARERSLNADPLNHPPRPPAPPNASKLEKRRIRAAHIRVEIEWLSVERERLRGLIEAHKQLSEADALIVAGPLEAGDEVEEEEDFQNVFEA